MTLLPTPSTRLIQDMYSDTDGVLRTRQVPDVVVVTTDAMDQGTSFQEAVNSCQKTAALHELLAQKFEMEEGIADLLSARAEQAGCNHEDVEGGVYDDVKRLDEEFKAALEDKDIPDWVFQL